MLIASQLQPRPAEPPALVWDESSCPLCHGRHWSPLLEAQDPAAGAAGLWFAVVQCDSCGLCFTNPRPDPASVGRFYPDAPATPPQPGRPMPRHGEGRLLDVGCGRGDFLALMHARGWQVTGLDAASRAVDRVRGELGLPAFVGTLPHLDLDPESFDVITMWHTLERVHDPLPLLREARKLLVPGGKLVAAVPNIDSLPFRWFGRHWAGLDLPRHLTHFTATSLPQMLQRAGLVTEPVQYVRRPDWLRRSAGLACATQAPAPLWQRLLRYRPAAYVTTWACYLANQADCLMIVGYR